MWMDVCINFNGNVYEVRIILIIILGGFFVNFMMDWVFKV